MRFWVKVLILVVTWSAYIALEMYVTSRHWVILMVLVGFFGMVTSSSAMIRLFTGRWPDWRGVWRMFRD